MNETDREKRNTPRQWVVFLAAAGLLWSVLLILYSSPLRTTYFFMDEILYLRPQPFPVLGAFWMPFVFGLSNGRPVSYFIWGIYLGIASNWDGLHWLRVLHFGVIATALSLLLYVLYRRSRSIWWAVGCVLVLSTQPVTQISFIITIVTTYWLAAVIGCCVFLYLHRHRADLGEWRSARRRLTVAAAFLLVAWMTFQGGPFCGLALAGYYALTATPEGWRDERRAVLSFVGVLIATMAVYLVVYRALLFATGAETYELVGPAFSTLTGASIGTESSWLRLSNYLGPFEWWNYILPVEPLSDVTFLWLASLSALACATVLSLACAIEVRRAERSWVYERYAVAVVALLLTFLPLVADGFTMRQHIYIACVPAVILTVGYAAVVIVASLRLPGVVRVLLSGSAVAALCVLAWGARAGFERSLVQPTARWYSFARQQARRAADRSFTHIAVIIPPSECLQEPCRGMFRYRMPWGDPDGMAGSHRKIVQDETGRSDFDLKLSAPIDHRRANEATTLWIDYRDLQSVEAGDLDQSSNPPGGP